MRRIVYPILLLSSVLFSLVKCDSYKFPKAPYPRVETLAVANITKAGVTFQASITQFGITPIVNHGFVWGLSENLSIEYDDDVQLGATSSNKFEANVTSGLKDGETYLVRAFVATDDYIVYGKAMSFKK